MSHIVHVRNHYSTDGFIENCIRLIIAACVADPIASLRGCAEMWNLIPHHSFYIFAFV